MNPMPEYQPIEPLEPMNNNPSGKSRLGQVWPGCRDSRLNYFGFYFPWGKEVERVMTVRG
jgi:hypothetical protein